MLPTVILAAGGAVAIVVLLFSGLIAAGVVAAVWALVCAPIVGFRIQGATGVERIMRRVNFGRARRAGRTTYRAGPVGARDGSLRLPGILAASELWSGTHVLGTRFGMIFNPGPRTATVLFGAHATGTNLVDQPDVDLQVARWGEFLASLGTEPDVVGASVTVETAPDPGSRLANAVAAESDHGYPVPTFAAATAEQIVALHAEGADSTRATIAVTFSAAPRRAVGVPARTPAGMLTDLGIRVPGLLDGLQGTGAGTVTVLDPAAIIDGVQTAYNPAAATDIELARLSGEGTGLTWEEAGPSFAQESYDTYIHDTGVSRTWQMWEAPRGEFTETQLAGLLAPHPNVMRKRVSVLYRPQPADTAAREIQRAVDDATFTLNTVAKPNEHQRSALRVAQATAAEEARGAGLVRFAVLVTATVAETAELALAADTVNRLAVGHAHIRLRPALGQQAVAFTANLGLGVVLAQHSQISLTVWDAL